MKKLYIAFVLLIFNLKIYSDNNRFRWDTYSTHQPVLYSAVISTKGPIIEFGCGYGSTDMLHEICEKDHRILITLEDDLSWMEKFSSKYEGRGYNKDNTGWHKFYFVPGKNPKDHENPSHWVKFLNEFKLLDELNFDVCFIDQSPWLARYETLKKMKQKARFVIIHDVDYFPMKNIFGKVIKPISQMTEGEFDFHDVFIYYKVFFPDKPWPGFTGPPTLIGSNIDSNFPDVDFSKNIDTKEQTLN